MVRVNCEYCFKQDIAFFMESEKMNMSDLSEKTKIARGTLNEVKRRGISTQSVYEKFYSYAYSNNYRINSVKEEILKENNNSILFHGSKEGLSEISIDGSRDNCDFGKGFYLGETYNQALSFICDYAGSSVYSFSYSTEGLNIKRFNSTLDWMLAICHYRGTLQGYSDSVKVKEIIDEVEKADVIIAPIADNKMFYVMAQFTDGEINADVAIHSLSASTLGMQYVFKTERSLNTLKPIEKYYICNPERENCKKQLAERSFEIDTKLKLAKREYKSGLYIEEIL